MANNSSSGNGSNEKTDWSKKGLGWIPDYPDLRDLELKKDDIKLQREGVTTEIENLSTSLIRLARTLSQNPNSQLPSDKVEQHISELENRVFGGIKFANVRVHRLLRYEMVEDYPSDSKIRGQSDRSKQILSLKNYLSILATQKYLKLSESIAEKFLGKDSSSTLINIRKEVPNLDLFSEDPAQIDDLLCWLRKDTFDSSTKVLVMVFQHCAGILVDGVVGLETYRTLNDYFLNSCRLSELRCRVNKLEEELEAKTELQSNYTSQVKTRLISIPSVISTSVFGIILEHLKQTAIKQIQDELDDKDNEVAKRDKIFERSFLRGNRIDESLFSTFAGDKFDEFILGSNKTKLRREDRCESKEDKVSRFVNHCIEGCDLNIIKNFTEIFYGEFFIVEPLVSTIWRMISPLAYHGNRPIDTIVEQAFKTVEKILIKKWELPLDSNLRKREREKALVKLKNDQSLFHTLTFEEIESFVQEAVGKVTQLLEPGLKALIDEHQPLKQSLEDQKNGNADNDSFARMVCFYFLIKKLLNRYTGENHSSAQIEQLKIIQDRKPSIFDKQELFELELGDLLDQSRLDALRSQESDKNEPDKNGPNKNLELFPGLKLQIPVSEYLTKSFQKRCLKSNSNADRFYVFLPSVVDLSYWCSPVQDQRSLNACTAFAGVALVEYFANRQRGRYSDLSPLFLYKAARNLMFLTGDVGASVRETMRAMVLFGVPPEKFWPYEESRIDEEPSPLCYSYAQNFQTLKYFRLDYAGMSQELLLSQIKATLAAGFPCMFGFTVYTSAYEETLTDRGFIPFPNAEKDRVVGGHAVVAVGYDDFQKIPTADDPSKCTRGALLIQNSWGRDWGRNGYGWIPYEYVLCGLTRDWWSLLKSEWFEDDSLGLGAISTNTGGEECDRSKGGKC